MGTVSGALMQDFSRIFVENGNSCMVSICTFSPIVHGMGMLLPEFLVGKYFEDGKYYFLVGKV